MPKVSVIMPAYNAEKYIAEAIDSILGQTFGDFEFIILNDCSADRTEEIILSYDDPRIVYLQNEGNLGVAATLNKGLAAVKGEYIARMDADDISLPERFAKQVKYLDEHNDVAVLGCSIERFSSDRSLDIRSFSADVDSMMVDMLFACGVAHPSVMMRTEVIRSLGGYDEEFNGLEDYELWCRVLEKHKITTLPDVLLRYRIHGSQVTQNPSARYLELLRALKTRQLRQLGLEPAETFLHYCEGKRPDTPKEIKELDKFFALIDSANGEKHIYDSEKLCASFRAVLQSCAATLPCRVQYHLTTICKYLKLRKLIWFWLKRKGRRILKV